MKNKLPSPEYEFWITTEKQHLRESPYSTKEYDTEKKKYYGILYSPIQEEGKLKAGLVIKYPSNRIAESFIIHWLIGKTNFELFFNFFIVIPVLILCPLLVIFTFSLLFSRSMNHPLQELINMTEHIRQGQLDFPLQSTYENEWGEVMNSFEKMRKALKGSLKKQWIMEEQRKEMILSLTHNIKTPITIIHGHLELLSMPSVQLSEEEKQASIQVLQNNAERMRHMINQLNEIWDLERPNFQLQIEKIPLQKFICTIKDNVLPLCHEKNTAFSILCSIDENKEIYFDSSRIQEVIENIVSNSLKHIEHKGKILLHVVDQEEKLRFIIEDDGRGFQHDEIQHIFAKNYKGNDSTLFKNSSGLGLYLSKMIIEKHGGIIRAYNNQMGGATIEFELPLKIKQNDATFS
ncbi:HAMP domain-containing sensor histidine kinase [Caldalkalibacillus mannanilyticus]|uniref:HAMP domain-containing sensor histidine kinase n=1 Tax=Caldalkalibacillus mannanilyticus TaxID=1418 RepID=UPI001F43C631|nr:HAMP domain-containing sensor histidine kinase [Caldalkalibacillus mannanilyticus]